jgi:hypothetical protein
MAFQNLTSLSNGVVDLLVQLLLRDMPFDVVPDFHEIFVLRGLLFSQYHYLQ